MSESDRVAHMWRVAELVARLEKHLLESGRLDDGTRQRIIEIRMALLDGVEASIRPSFSGDRTPPPV